MKQIIIFLLALTLIFPLTGCLDNGIQPASAVSETGDSQDRIITITLGDEVTASGYGVKIVDGSKLILSSAATYSISGTLNDGQIIVNNDEKGTVKLILNGVNITCSDSAPVYIKNADKTVITLADGTENYITDGDSYTFVDATSDEPGAAIFSKDDLTINGNGSLTVNANYKNGIQSKDDLKITGGNITVNAVGDAIKGKDSITVKDATVTVKAGADGMQSSNGEDEGKGYVSIDSGTINITAFEDGVQAETDLTVAGGDIIISTGGGSASVSNISTAGDFADRGMGMRAPATSVESDSAVSAKGLKAGIALSIKDGNINIDSSDDAINSSDSLTIDGGNIVLASGDDGLHADNIVEINGGDINIAKCYEGIESTGIIINDGNIRLVSSDDGLNASSGGGDFAMGGGTMGRQMGGPGGQFAESSGDNYLKINGGYLAVDAKGDGLDVNGPITMTGGTVIVNGPTMDGNGPLDYSGEFKITGGFLVAAGSSGMAMAPSTTSTLYSIMYNFSSAQTANTIVHIEDENGKGVLTFIPTKSYQSVVLCSSELKNGSTYTIYSGGSSTGTLADSLYSGGTYTAGTEVTSFTISSIVTSLGKSGGFGFAGAPGGGGQFPR